MARMKFLCDADRCIECNACVTACKNEHEVPWGINRRRVVTINDGRPGERSVSMACMHCTDAPCAAVCPVNCFYTTADAVVLHSKDLCIGCGYCFYACPFGAPQYPRVGNFGSRGKMDKCTFCAGGPEADNSQAEFVEVRHQPAGGRQAAAVRRDVLDQVAARRRRRDHRPDLPRARGQARLRLRRLGMADRLSRDDRDVTGRERQGGKAMTAFLARIRIAVGVLALLAVVAVAVPASAQQTEPGRLGQSDRERRAGGAAAQGDAPDRRPLHAAGPEGLHARAAGRPRLAAASIR